jgi:anti-sigma regulatory factor (Ser/Thr protein kinase)
MQGVIQEVQAIETFLRDAGCGAKSVHQMTVVAEEVLSNILRDAWPDRAPGQCVVDVEATRTDDVVHVCLRTADDGIAFDPTAAEAPDLEASLEERSIGGLGIVFIRAMTDAQTYRRSDGRNIFEVRKICSLT